MEHSERLKDIAKLGYGINMNTGLLWYKHGGWLMEQAEKVEEQRLEILELKAKQQVVIKHIQL